MRPVGRYTPRAVLEQVALLTALGKLSERPIDFVLSIAVMLSEPASEQPVAFDRIFALAAMQHRQAMAFPVSVVPLAFQLPLLGMLEGLVASGLPMEPGAEQPEALRELLRGDGEGVSGQDGAPVFASAGEVYTAVGRVSDTLPAPGLEYVAPSLREKFAALPDEERNGIRWDQQSPEQLYSDLPASELTMTLVDVAARKMVEATRQHAANLELLESRVGNFTEEGLAEAYREIGAATAQVIDKLELGLAGRLEQLDSQAAGELVRYQGETFKVPTDVELVARQRWQDAFAVGPKGVASLFDGLVAANDPTSAHAVVRIAEAAIAAAKVHADPEAYSRAQDVAPLVAALANGLKPPTVHRAEQTRAAVSEARQRARVIRAALGV